MGFGPHAVVTAKVFILSYLVLVINGDNVVAKGDTWELPVNHVAYRGLHNNLTELLKAQNIDGWVSVLTYSLPFKSLLLNCMYSLKTYGKVSNFIVAAFDNVTLSDCLKRDLPCYNGSQVTHTSVRDPTLAPEHYLAENYRTIVWAKVNLTKNVLERNFSMFFADVDVAFIRNVRKSYRKVFEYTKADAVFMRQERGHTVLNSGVYALKSNHRSISLISRWLSLRTASGARGNQPALQVLAYRSYGICDSLATCQVAKSRKLAAVYLSPSPLKDGQFCLPDLEQLTICDPRNLFLHMHCNQDSGAKIQGLKKHGLWFLDDDDVPLNDTHWSLPCENEVAWNGYIGV